MKLSILIPTCKPEVNKQIEDIKATIFHKEAEIITSCQPVSASKNRNYCLDRATGDICIQADDDITGFYPGWDRDLVQPLLDFPTVGIVAARLLKVDGSLAFMSGLIGDDVSDFFYAKDDHLCTACFAMRKDSLRFDENFMGSGFEDTDFGLQFKLKYLDSHIVINNRCKLVHVNEQKNQGGKYWEHNKAYFLNKWENHEDTWHD